MDFQQYKNTVAIHDFLPHRAPMLLVDLILELNDLEVKTIFQINEDTLFVENNVLAEAGLIENAAQTCSSIVAKGYFLDENNEDKEGVKVIGFISGIKKLKVHHLPEVGQTIFTHATLGSRYDCPDYSICTILCKTFYEDKLLFEAEINLFIQEEK